MMLILLLAALLTQQCLADVPARHFLAFGGYGSERSVNLYSTDQENIVCQLPNLPHSAKFKPQGSVIDKNIAICGGGMEFCMTLTGSDGWTKFLELDVASAPAIVSPDNSIWTFFGGRFNEKSINVWTQGQDEFEKVNVEFELGENLCAVRRNDSHAIISAGSQDVYWYKEDGQTFQKWDTEGRSHVIDASCGILKSEERGELFVSAGGRLLDNPSMPLRTVDIFNFELKMWLEGQELPYPVAGAAALNLGNTFGFIGGMNDRESSDQRALQYNYEAGWVELPVKLNKADKWLGVLMLEEGDITC